MIHRSSPPRNDEFERDRATTGREDANFEDDDADFIDDESEDDLEDSDFDDDEEEDFADEDEDDESALAELTLSPLGLAARALQHVLERETSLARHGGLAAFADAIAQKRDALAAFSAAMGPHSVTSLPTGLEAGDREAVRRLMAAADENALVLEAVRSTIDDLSARLRNALTAASDPGTYGPGGKGPRHARAAQFDTRI